jgi:Regulator of chromosome condensation (RCC1) repeat
VIVTVEATIGAQNPHGIVYMFGQGDFGQLGIDAAKRKYPAKVPELPQEGAEVSKTKEMSAILSGN